MPNYNWECEHCGTYSVHSVPYENRNDVNMLLCDGCGNTGLTWRPSMPTVMQVSYPDGLKRKGWGDLRAWSKLNLEKLRERGKGKRADKQTMQEIKQEMARAAESGVRATQHGHDGVPGRITSDDKKEG